MDFWATAQGDLATGEVCTTCREASLCEMVSHSKDLECQRELLWEIVYSKFYYIKSLLIAIGIVSGGWLLLEVDEGLQELWNSRWDIAWNGNIPYQNRVGKLVFIMKVDFTLAKDIQGKDIEVKKN